MQKICPVCSNSWQKETRTAEDKLRILFTEVFGDAENDLNQDAIALISYRSLCLEKICSRMLRSRMNE